MCKHESDGRDRTTTIVNEPRHASHLSVEMQTNLEPFGIWSIFINLPFWGLNTRGKQNGMSVGVKLAKDIVEN